MRWYALAAVLLVIAVAALFATQPSQPTQAGEPTQPVKPQTAELTAQDLLIQRRALARLQKLIRLAQRSKDSKKKSSSTKTKKKSAPAPKKKKKAAPAPKKKAAPAPKKKKAAPAPKKKKAAPPPAKKKAAPPPAKKKAAPPPAQKKAAPPPAQKKAAPPAKKEVPPVQKVVPVPTDLTKEKAPPAKETAPETRPGDKQEQENAAFCKTNPSSPKCGGGEQPSPPEKTPPPASDKICSANPKYPGCSQFNPPSLTTPPGGGGRVPSLCKQNPQLPQCQPNDTAPKQPDPPGGNQDPPGGGSPIPPSPTPPPPPSGETEPSGPTIQVVPECAEGQVLFAGNCVTPGNCPDGQVQYTDYSSDPPQSVCGNSCPEGMVERLGGCIGQVICFNQGGTVYNMEQCVEQCPEGSLTLNDRCYDQCPEGYGNMGDGTCGDCPDGQEAVNGQCVPVVGCPEGQFSSPGGLCVPDNCPDGTYRAPDYQCVAQCPEGTTATSNSSMDAFCRQQCPEGQFAEFTRCVTQCSTGYDYVVDGQCLTACPDGQEDVNGACVATCLPGTIREGNQCVAGCEEGQQLFAGQCIFEADCPGGKLGRPTEDGGRECVSRNECLENDYMVEHHGTCVGWTVCRDAGGVISDRECLEQCPQGQQANSEALCLDQSPEQPVCEPGNLLVDGACIPATELGYEDFVEICIAELESGVPVPPELLGETNGETCQNVLDNMCQEDQAAEVPRCVERPCPDSQENVGGQCLATCGAGQEHGEDGQCVTPPVDCPEGQFGSAGQCVQSCPDGTVADNGQCQQCPSGEGEFNGQCVRAGEETSCSGDLYLVAGRCLTKAFCNTYGGATYEGECVEDCPVGTTSDGSGGCTATATDDTPPDEGVPPPDGAPPAEGEQPPAEGEQPPAEGEQPPEGTPPPAEDQQPPAEGEQPPVEGEQPPDGAPPPAEDQQPPDAGTPPPPPDTGTPPPDSGTPPPGTGTPPPPPGTGQPTPPDTGTRPKPPAPGKAETKAPGGPVGDDKKSLQAQHPLAMVIANARYSSKVIPNSRHAIGGAAAVVKFLKDDMLLSSKQIIPLRNGRLRNYIALFGKPGAPAGRLQRTLASAPASEVIIYYSGRAMPVEGGKDVVLLPRDANPKRPLETGYRLSTLYENLAALGVKRLRLYLDTSFAGKFGAQPTKDAPPTAKPVVAYPAIGPLGMFTPKGWSVMTAATRREPAFADPKRPRSAFADALLAGLRGLADTTGAGNNDGAVTGGELLPFVRQQVDAAVKRATGGGQKPGFFGRKDTILRVY